MQLLDWLIEGYFYKNFRFFTSVDHVWVFLKFGFCFQGAKREGSSPDGKSYLECAEKSEIKSLLSA
jgi:hypothetical protein